MSYDDEVTMFARDEPSYSRISLEKHVEDDSSDDGTANPTDSLLRLYQKKLKRRFTTRAIIASVAASIWLVSSVASYWLGLRSVDLDRRCLEHTSAYSPVLKDMEPGYKMVKFNGTLGYSNEYTGGAGGDPTPEVDAAWEKWAYVKYASIPDEEFAKLPGDYPDASKLTPEYGGGYIGFLEVSHHMHCLNLLRKGVHRDYYMNESHKALEFTDRPWTVKLHLTHCIEMLRQNIMCNADVGIITHQWIKQSPDPFANFNTWHKCRDISTVEKWIHDNEIPTTPDNSDLPIPLGSKIFDQPP